MCQPHYLPNHRHTQPTSSWSRVQIALLGKTCAHLCSWRINMIYFKKKLSGLVHMQCLRLRKQLLLPWHKWYNLVVSELSHMSLHWEGVKSIGSILARFLYTSELNVDKKWVSYLFYLKRARQFSSVSEKAYWKFFMVCLVFFLSVSFPMFLHM